MNEILKGQVLSPEQKKYFEVHRDRYKLILNIVGEFKNEIRKQITILDIGPSFLTKLLKLNFNDDSIIALGLFGKSSQGGHLPSEEFLTGIEQIEYNLNNVNDKQTWPDVNKKFDVIIIAEVIEHLYTAPEYVLRFLKEILAADGIIILQTPNAVSLIKRLQMLSGKNPYEMIRENYENPGHYREYTMSEIKDLVQKENLVIKKYFCDNYFRLIPNTWKVKGYRFLQNVLGKKFKDGITIVISKS